MSNRFGSQNWMTGTLEDREAMQKIYWTKSDRALTKAVALDPDNVARLAERLTQIIPEVAEDPSLRKIPGWRRFDNLITAFEASADPAVVADMRRLIEDPETWWDYSGSFGDLPWGTWYLLNVENDWEEAMAKAEALDPDNLETKLARAVNHIWPQSWSWRNRRRCLTKF